MINCLYSHPLRKSVLVLVFIGLLTVTDHNPVLLELTLKEGEE